MEQLDNNKPPKIGSQGEKYRDLQLIMQLPKQVSLKFKGNFKKESLLHIVQVWYAMEQQKNFVHETGLFYWQDLSEEYLKNLKTAGQRRAFEEFKHLRDMEVMDVAEVRDYIVQDMVSN